MSNLCIHSYNTLKSNQWVSWQQAQGLYFWLVVKKNYSTQNSFKLWRNYYPSPIDLGMGYCFRSISLFVCIFVCLYLCFFVSKITRKWLDQFALNFQGRCRVTMGWPVYIFGQLRETMQCHDAQHGDGVCCALAPQLVLQINMNMSTNSVNSAILFKILLTKVTQHSVNVTPLCLKLKTAQRMHCTCTYTTSARSATKKIFSARI